MTDTGRKGDEFEIFTFDAEEEEGEEVDTEDGMPEPIGEKMERILYGGDDIPEQPPELLEEHNESAT